LGLRSGGKERKPHAPAEWVGYNYRFAFIFWHSRAALTAEDCRYHNGFSWWLCGFVCEPAFADGGVGGPDLLAWWDFFEGVEKIVNRACNPLRWFLKTTKLL
jgi:hypothetical protein